MSDQKQNDDYSLLANQAAAIRERYGFVAVQIIAVRELPGTKQEACRVTAGSGNWFTRCGMMHDVWNVFKEGLGTQVEQPVEFD